MTNNKGGVGKSAVVRELAAALARREQRVLCADLDPQANLSRRLGFVDESANPRPTLADAIKADQTGCAADIIVPCGWDERIDLLPSSFDLENRISEAGTVGAVQRLRNVTAGVTKPYAWRLLDCPPSLGHLTQLGLVMAGSEEEEDGPGFVVIVLEPEFDAMTGALRVRDFVEQYSARLGVPKLRVGGVIVNRVRHTELHTANIADIAEAFDGLLWEPYIPLWTVLADANNSAVPLSSLGSRAKEMATLFDALADQMEAA
ncbi:MAG: AAA family ATPase [Longispora sp.]|nr:AAA family ATPase [Longispora sp. (in: high G+C Gram-positive bacteria)]